MAQILDPLPQNNKNAFLCCYVNATSHIQIARITNIPNWYFERVVFPGQRLVFETLAGALVEIHSGMMASSILSDTIPCERLVIDEGDDDDLELEPAQPQVASHLVSVETVRPSAIARSSQFDDYSSLQPILV